MKNVWKGMVVGTVTGAGVGIVLDALERAGQRGGELSRRAATTVRDAADDGVTRVKDAHLPEKAKEIVDEAAAKVREAEEQVLARAQAVSSNN